jgi:hypothetical protein
MEPYQGDPGISQDDDTFHVRIHEVHRTHHLLWDVLEPQPIKQVILPDFLSSE